MDRRLISLAALATASLFAAEARAQDQSGWRGSVTPYLWLAGFEGHVGALVDAPPVPVDAEFPSIFDHLSGAFMGKAEIGYGRFGALGDIAYLKVAGDHNRQVGGVLALSGEIEAATTEATLAGYWRAYQSPAWDVDLVAGARYTKAEVEVDLTANSRHVTGNADRDRWDPVLGARATVRLNDRWSLTGYGDVGLSSETMWQAYGAVNYRFNDLISGSLGYRYYKASFSQSDFTYDAQVGGPMLGLTFSF